MKFYAVMFLTFFIATGFSNASDKIKFVSEDIVIVDPSLVSVTAHQVQKLGGYVKGQGYVKVKFGKHERKYRVGPLLGMKNYEKAATAAEVMNWELKNAKDVKMLVKLDFSKEDEAGTGVITQYKPMPSKEIKRKNSLDSKEADPPGCEGAIFQKSNTQIKCPDGRVFVLDTSIQNGTREVIEKVNSSSKNRQSKKTISVSKE